MKKGVLVLLISVVFLTGFVAAELDVTITGTVSDLTSEVSLKTDTNSAAGTDGYDMVAPDSPSSYTKFSSSVGSESLAIDTRPTSVRTVNLIYHASDGPDADVALSWDSIGSGITGNLISYGSDSSYTSQESSTNMLTSSSKNIAMGGETDLYIQVVIGTPSTGGGGDSGSGGGGGGGGGGSATSLASPESLTISPGEYNFQAAVDTVRTKSITITNNKNDSAKIKINTQGISEMLEFTEASFTLASYEKKIVSFRLIAPAEPGIYPGKIIVNGIEVPISLAVGTKELLFDASVVIPDNYKIIDMGAKLGSQITLIPMGEDPRLDVTLKYSVKDFNGKTFLSESETILVNGQKTFKKEFPTQNLPTGKYILGLELVYPNGVATSTSHFAVRGQRNFFADYKYVLISLGIAVLILVVLIIFVMRGRKMFKSSRR